MQNILLQLFLHFYFECFLSFLFHNYCVNDDFVPRFGMMLPSRFCSHLAQDLEALLCWVATINSTTNATGEQL